MRVTLNKKLALKLAVSVPAAARPTAGRAKVALRNSRGVQLGDFTGSAKCSGTSSPVQSPHRTDVGGVV
ncbi:hypothetical protein [Amycolatopsis sp. cmx-8-4]|uniref:hypothetical protein n=1 Tax=Amycolatopsis sp. cmx-8-4 TaxID=2790947 RepID=UPI00397AEAC9